MQPDSPQDLPTALGHRQPVMNDERESARTLRLGKASIGTRANKIEDLATHHEILASHQESVMASVSLRLDDDVAARLQQLSRLASEWLFRGLLALGPATLPRALLAGQPSDKSALPSPLLP